MFKTKVLELFLREKQHIAHYQVKSYLVKKKKTHIILTFHCMHMDNISN